MMISVNFSVALAIAFAWTIVFSMTNKFPVRGLRNLGILACYIIGISMFFAVGFKTAGTTWVMFGLVGGGLYFIYNLIVWAKANAGEAKPRISIGHFIYGQFAWPVMGSEAIEYTLAEIGVLKLPKPKEGEDGECLSPETDQFLREALEEHNRNNDILKEKWSFENYASWGFDQETGLFFLQLEDGSRIEADGQILGSHDPAKRNWEWAWNNPHVLDAMKRDSIAVRKFGEEHQISYLCAPVVPMPDKQFATYLAAVGEKITASQGVYPANVGTITGYVMLKNLRKNG